MKLLSLLLSFIFVACVKVDSDEIVEQRDIRAKFKVEANRDSRKIVGTAWFYEKKINSSDNYVALRGSSYAEFEGFRMMEVTGWGESVRYTNNFQERNLNSTYTYDFKYVNNDDIEFIATLELPSFAKIDTETIKVSYLDSGVVLNFNSSWIEQNELSDMTNLTVEINSTRSYMVKQANIGANSIVIPNDEEYGSIGLITSIKLCSQVVSKKYLSNLGEKLEADFTGEFCDRKIVDL